MKALTRTDANWSRSPCRWRCIDCGALWGLFSLSRPVNRLSTGYYCSPQKFFVQSTGLRAGQWMHLNLCAGQFNFLRPDHFDDTEKFVNSFLKSGLLPQHHWWESLSSLMMSKPLPNLFRQLTVYFLDLSVKFSHGILNLPALAPDGVEAYWKESWS